MYVVPSQISIPHNDFQQHIFENVDDLCFFPATCMFSGPIFCAAIITFLNETGITRASMQTPKRISKLFYSAQCRSTCMEHKSDEVQTNPKIAPMQDDLHGAQKMRAKTIPRRSPVQVNLHGDLRRVALGIAFGAPCRSSCIGTVFGWLWASPFLCCMQVGLHGR